MSDKENGVPRPTSAAEIAARYAPSEPFLANIGWYRDLWVRLRPQPLTDRLLLGHVANPILRQIKFERQPWTDDRDEATKLKEQYEADVRLCAYGFVEPRFVVGQAPDIANNETGPAHYHYNEIHIAARYVRGETVPPTADPQEAPESGGPPFRADGLDDPQPGELEPDGGAGADHAEPVAVDQSADGNTGG